MGFGAIFKRTSEKFPEEMSEIISGRISKGIPGDIFDEIVESPGRFFKRNSFRNF